jgi:hypothetical protein
VLVRRPGYCLDGSEMIGKFNDWICEVIVPDEQLVVVAA